MESSGYNAKDKNRAGERGKGLKNDLKKRTDTLLEAADGGAAPGSFFAFIISMKQHDLQVGKG